MRKTIKKIIKNSSLFEIYLLFRKFLFSFKKNKKIKYFREEGEEMLQKLSLALNEHEIIFWLEFGTLMIDSTTVPYGTVPTHADPTKEADDQYTYSFAGWDPTPFAVTGDATYTATYSQTENPVVAYVDANGKVHSGANWEVG